MSAVLLGVGQKKQRAKLLVHNKQFQEAKLLILDIIALEERNRFKLYGKLGDICIELNEFIEAQKYYQHSLDAEPLNPKIYIKYGNLLSEYLNNTFKAQIMYEECIKLNSDHHNDECWFYFGKLMFKLKDYDKSLEYYSKCKAERACIYYHLSKVFIKRNNKEKAKLSLERAIKIQPSVVLYHHQYALCLADLMLFIESRIAFEKAVQLSQSKDIKILYDFAQLLSIHLNDNTKALEYLRKATENDNKNDFNYVQKRYSELFEEELNIEYDEKDENEYKMECQVDTDEWENVSDFVLTEYIRDLCDELPMNLLNALDDFIKKMEFIGIKSAKSRSRALIILENMKRNEKVNEKMNESMIIALKIANGHILDAFDCIQCQTKHDLGGIELRNCLHKICYKCFQIQISQCINRGMVPICAMCGYNIHIKDIKIHIDETTADIVENLKSKTYFRMSNMIHRSTLGEYSDYHGNYHISIEEFRSNWNNINECDISNSNMIECFDVEFESDEWNKVIQHIRDPKTRNIEKIERIQNAEIWRYFWNYCIEQRVKQGIDIKVGGFFHGTQTCKPSSIWERNGFDKSYARIGNCLWFATENTYSMSGWQYAVNHNQNQVFLAFVATGNLSHCKFIRNDQILNVFKNEATYPAYLITYSNQYNDSEYL